MIKLNDGNSIPEIGFGTCKHGREGTIDSIILKAMEAGYRYFDTASFYDTERDLGRAVQQSKLNRSDLFIATKLWYEELGYQNTKDALRRSLDRLNMDYIDVYMIHWPKASYDNGWEKVLIETWTALEEAKSQGLFKTIGVCNFLPHHLNVIKREFNTLPAVDQLELHLGYFQEYAFQFLQQNGILAQAWSPIGRGQVDFSESKVLVSMAEKYGVSIQQLSLRYLIQRGIMPLPWSTSFEHMKKNLQSFDFTINQEDMSVLSCMPQYTWLGEHPDFKLPLNKHLPVVS